MEQRTLTLDRPLIAFDLETTGLDVAADRIIEISCVKLNPDGSEEVRTRRLNPEMPILADATRVHGIRDEDVRDCPTFVQVARSLHTFFSGCDLTGYNLSKFDLRLLRREFEACHLAFPDADTRVIDSYVLYALQEPRTLAAAYSYYCGRMLEGAHGAEADARAAAAILKAQVARYESLPVDVMGLHRLCRPDDWVDEQGKLVWRNGEATIGFGKYKGRPLQQVAQQDPSFLQWMERADFPNDVRTIVRAALRGEFPNRPIDLTSAQSAAARA